MKQLIRLAEQSLLVVLGFMATIRLWPLIREEPFVLLFLASELVAVFLILVQRRGDWTQSPYPVVIAFVGTVAALLVSPGGNPIAPTRISAFLLIMGVGIALGAKISLGRSFGLVPANRGVKHYGLYRVVRHPMYAGYVISHIGYLMLHMSAWNLSIYAVAWAALMLRIIEEERFLTKDEAYRVYMSKVRYRLIPGLI